MTPSRTLATGWCGLAAGVVSAALLVAPWHSFALAGALLLLCVPGGAAVMCWIDCGTGLAQAGLTLVVSLALFSLTSTLMVWASAWHPLALLAFAGLAAASCLCRVSLGRPP